MDIMPYDICFTKHPIKRWDNSGREILDSTNLFIVSHHKGMSYERDSLFPYLVRGGGEVWLVHFLFLRLGNYPPAPKTDQTGILCSQSERKLG